MVGLWGGFRALDFSRHITRTSCGLVREDLRAITLLCNRKNDPEEDRRPGKPEAVIHGLVSNTYLWEVCASLFGAPWLTTGRLSVRYLRPVIA